MFELRNNTELFENFEISVVYEREGRPLSSVKLSCKDVASDVTMETEVFLETFPSWKADSKCTLARLASQCTRKSFEDVINLCKNIEWRSGLYDDSLHEMTVSCLFDGAESIVTKRLFVVPGLDQKKSLDGICQIRFSQNNCEAGWHVSDEKFLEARVVFFARCTWGDVKLVDSSYVDKNKISMSLNLANYEMSNTIMAAIGTEPLSGKRRLVAYDYSGRGTTLVPATEARIVGTSDTSAGKKKVSFILEVSCEVFDGLRSIDYSRVFVENGFKLVAEGRPAVFSVNKNLL